MTKQEIFTKLITIAINGLSGNSYRDADSLKAFCSLPLSDLIEFWDGLSDQTRLMIVSSHLDELKAWVKSTSRGE